MKYSLPLIIALLMVVSCKPTVPSAYIQPDDMEDILYDYHIAESMAKNDFGQDIELKRNIYFQAVLMKHNVSEADFDSSLVYYYSHLDRLKDIYSRVNVRLADEAKRVGAAVSEISQYSQLNANGDTANIWTGVTNALLIPRPTKNRFDFTVKVDTTFRLGDSFMFQFMTEYIWQVQSPDAYACIVLRYENDSIQQYHTRVTSSKGLTQLRVPSNMDSPLKEFRGFVYLCSGDQADVRRLMFMNQIQLIRFHNKNPLPAIDGTEEPKDSLATDSVKRIDNPRGETADSASHPVGRGLRSKTIPFRKGGGSN